MVRSRTKLLSFVSCLLIGASGALAKVENDFSLYPGDAQSCLEDASDNSKCDGDTVTKMNGCLCSNGGGFVTSTARCLGQKAPDLLRITWSTMNTSCDDSNTPLAIDEDDFIGIGQRETATTNAPSSTATSTSNTKTESSSTSTSTDAGAQSTNESGESNTNNDNTEDTGLSVGAKAAIGVGSAVGAAVLGAVIFMIWKSRRSRAAHDEARQAMLGRNGPEAGLGPYSSQTAGWNGAEEKAAWRPVSDVADSRVGAATPPWLAASTAPQEVQKWGHHPDQAWPGSPGRTQAAVPSPPVPAQQPGVYELSNSEHGVMAPPGPAFHAYEMSASPSLQSPPPFPGQGRR